MLLLILIVRFFLQTYLWVLNHEIDFEHAFDKLKVEGVMTDFPSRLTSYLANHESKGTPSNKSSERTRLTGKVESAVE